MDVFRSKEEICSKRPSAVALGFFDGLHIGHIKLIEKCVTYARSKDLSADVFTFRDHPKNVLSGKLVIPRLLLEQEKLKLLEELGVDRVYDFDFSDGFHTMPPLVFAETFLKDKFSAQAVFCGFNYHFGAEASGNTKSLSDFGDNIGFETYILDPVYVENRLVSSSLIRRCINNGEVEPAGRLLGRDYGFNGIVEKGNKLGRSFGFPTANIVPEPELTLPALGVYVTETYEKGICYASVSNVGFNPTVSKGPKGKAVRVETHLLDTDCSLYGKKIDVFFKKMLRKERCYESKEALIRQIAKDAESARIYHHLR
jgi:riboflavin kinase/FMN adenylyltransferase